MERMENGKRWISNFYLKFVVLENKKIHFRDFEGFWGQTQKSLFGFIYINFELFKIVN